MNSGRDSISVDTESHPVGFIVVRFTVGAIYPLRLVLNTGFVMTCLTLSARDNLTAFGHLRDTGERFPVLHDLSLGGRPLAPLPVRVNAAVARIAPEGMLGLNFLRQFREIHFDTETGRLTLRF